MTADPDVVLVRLGLIRELLSDLRSIGPVDAERLRVDRLTRHAVERILTQMVDIAVAINTHLAASGGQPVPGTYRESFLAVAHAGVLPMDLAQQLAPSAGLRNVLTHEYVAVDLDLVAAATATALVDYPQYVAAVARAIGGTAPDRRDAPGEALT